MDLVDIGLAVFGPVPPCATRRDDILACAQQTTDLIGVRPQRRIEDAVGFQGLDSVLVIGGEHTGRRLAAELAGIFADLLRTVAEHPDQFVGRVMSKMTERYRSDVAHAPLDYAIFLVDRRFNCLCVSLLDRRHCSSFANTITN